MKSRPDTDAMNRFGRTDNSDSSGRRLKGCGLNRIIAVFVLVSSALWGGLTLQAAEQPDVRLSPILQEWNIENQSLDLQFIIENNSRQTEDLSCIVMFDTRQGKRWQPQLLPGLPAGARQLIKVSFKPETVRQNDYIVSAVILYGENYQGLIERQDRFFRITEIETLGGRTAVAFSDVWPRGRALTVPQTIINTLAWNLADEQAAARRRQQLYEFRDERIRLEPILLPAAKIEPDIETVFLQVSATRPVQAATRIPVSEAITIDFDAAIDPGTVDAAALTVVPLSGRDRDRPLRGSVSVDDRRLIFKPAERLPYSTRLRLTAATTIRSAAGHRLKDPLVFEFITEGIPKAEVFGPADQFIKVRRVLPAVNGTDILLDTPIRILFDSAINPASATDDTLWLATARDREPVDIRVEKDEIRLIPRRPLQYGTAYLVRATDGLKDINGRQLKQAVQWRFETRRRIEYPETQDPNILIFSPSHEPESWVQETKGILQIGLTAFDPIRHLDVNGNVLEFNQDSQVQVEIPYELKSRQTDFQITAFTQVGMMQRRFTIHYGVKPPPRRPALIVAAILGTTTVDNLTNAPEGTDKIAATKAVLTIVPQYEFRIREDSSLKLKGILLRERYSDRARQNLETAYTQIAIDWEERKTFLGTLTASIGWNSIKTDNKNFVGENDVMTETFVAGSVKRQPDKEKRWEIGLEYKIKNSALQATDVDNDTDATAVSLDGKIRWPLFALAQNARLNYTHNDAVGQYQDFTAASLGYTLSYKIGDLTPSLGYTYTSKQMSRLNPTFGLTPAYTSGQTAIRLKYQLFKRSSLAFGVRSKTQLSNLAASTYTSNSATLDWTQIF